MHAAENIEPDVLLAIAADAVYHPTAPRARAKRPDGCCSGTKNPGGTSRPRPRSPTSDPYIAAPQGSSFQHPLAVQRA